MLRKIIISLLIVYLVFGFYLFLFQERLIYFPDDQDFYSCPILADYSAKSFNGTRFYFKNNSADSVVIFYHGNYGSACDRGNIKHHFTKLDKDIIFVEYAGYSNDVVRPSMKLIQNDVRNIAEFVRDYNEVNVIGESLGTGPASYQAKISKVDKLFLVSPFSSISDLAQSYYKIYPVKFMVRDNYDNIKWLKNYENKIIIVHSNNDNIIPPIFSQILYETLKTSDKEYILIRYSDHNNIWNSVIIKNLLHDFLI
jgi:uncharacterized protein